MPPPAICIGQLHVCLFAYPSSQLQSHIQWCLHLARRLTVWPCPIRSFLLPTVQHKTDLDHSSALPQDTVVAIKQGGDNLTISNMDEAKYPTATFSIDPKQVCTAALPNLVSVPKKCWCSGGCLRVYLYVNTCGDLQRVDLEHHTWANYFLAAYKVCLFNHPLPFFKFQNMYMFIEMSVLNVSAWGDVKGLVRIPSTLLTTMCTSALFR